MNKYEKPFIAGGYTDSDWNCLMGCGINDSLIDYAETYIADPLDRESLLIEATKPIWA